ncbi:MAG: hypothetical protein ACMG6S_10650 [Byssovorax sp.]
MPNIPRIQLISGRVVQLEELNQRFTYEGLQGGVPTTKMNQEIIERAVKRAMSPFLKEGPLVIQPVEVAVEPSDLDLDSPRWKWKRDGSGDPARIPDILCEGRFESTSPIHDTSQDGSSLIIVWFQSYFALPIDPAIVEQIKAIDWEGAAHDWEW